MKKKQSTRINNKNMEFNVFGFYVLDIFWVMWRNIPLNYKKYIKGKNNKKQSKFNRVSTL